MRGLLLRSRNQWMQAMVVARVHSEFVPGVRTRMFFAPCSVRWFMSVAVVVARSGVMQLANSTASRTRCDAGDFPRCLSFPLSHERDAIGRGVSLWFLSSGLSCGRLVEGFGLEHGE